MSKPNYHASTAILLFLTLGASGCESEKINPTTDNPGGGQDIVLDPAPESVSPTRPGQLLINEIMPNPSQLPDSEGEWIEILNPGPGPVDLQGCIISDASTVNFSIESELIAGTGGFVTFANSSNPGFEADIDYGASGLVLNNSSETVILTCNGIVIDETSYSGSSAGESLSLSADGSDTWCFDTINAYGAGDTGTPGETNLVCP